MSVVFQEENLYQDWLSHAHNSEILNDGTHRLRIINPGILNRHQGPDFVNSRFELDGIVYQGSVEMHLDSHDWYAHHHHLDPAFSDILLHIVRSASANHQDVWHVQRETAIPTFRLPPAQKGVARATFYCPLPALPPGEGLDILWEQAESRLEQKVRNFETALRRFPLQQVFVGALFRIAGYPHNTQAFELLAAVLYKIHLPQRLTAFAWLALLAGLSGLFDNPYPDNYTRLLQLAYRNLFYNRFVPLSSGVWKMGGCRPGNHPHFRMAGLAALLEKNPTVQIFNILSERQNFSVLFSRLRDYFQIPVSPYWSSHYALSKTVRIKRRFYWGKARIDEIVLNLILPLSIACSGRSDSSGFESYLRDIYQNWPSGVLYGRLKKRFSWYMPLLRAHPYHALGQGALAIEKTYCHQGACAQCPLMLSSHKRPSADGRKRPSLSHRGSQSRKAVCAGAAHIR